MDNDAIIQLLSDLVSIGSVNPGLRPIDTPWQGEKRLAEYVCDWFARHHIDAAIDEYRPGRCNVVARIEKDPSLPTVLLEAHLDTVDIEWPDGKRFDPEVRDGCLYGLGACDDKGGLCALMLAARELVESNGARKNVIIAATGDEEFGFTGVRRLLAGGVRAAGAIICEPTRLRVVRRHKAILRWTVRFHGKSAHSSTPHLGDNAVYRAARAIGSLEALAGRLARRPGSDLLSAPTLNVGTIHGGKQCNSVPDLCEIEIDRRVLPEEDVAAVENEIRGVIADALPVPGNWEMETLLSDLPLNTPADAWIVRALAAAAKRVFATVDIVGENYGTDASKTAAAGIPSVVFGPGDAAVVHAPGEHVPLAEIKRAIGCFVTLLRSGD